MITPAAPRPRKSRAVHPATVTTTAGRVVVVREPEHAPIGDPCQRPRCGLPASRHRDRKARAAQRREEKRQAELARPIVGIDGEGRDTPCPRCGLDDRDLETCPAGGGPCARGHVYTYLAAVDEDGEKRGSISRVDGLRTEEILAFLCDLGEPRLFGYSLGYDVTMWIADLTEKLIYQLMRPETRNRKLPNGASYRRRVRWHGFEIDYLRRKIEVRRYTFDAKTGKVDWRGPKTVIWDVFGFYQSAFVKSLADWKVCAKEEIDEIERMKDERAAFARMSRREIEAYCDDECRKLGKLVRRLLEAHEQANLPLKSFYGAGSTASALLDRMGTKEFKGPELPPELADAVQRAFFGGRFEASVIGAVAGTCHNYDISSAYPYAATRMPCLACGAWRRYTGRDADRAVREGNLAVVRCRVRKSGPTSWGPLPWRSPSVGTELRKLGMSGGAIVWPLALDETWTWREEYLAAKDSIWPGVVAEEAWVYTVSCAHTPFSQLPEAYRERCRIGKEGPGIVLKLGPNSVYGKCVQSIGKAPYRSMVWGGCITSSTRAQILRAIAAARDPRSILMVATDGILCAERLTLPAPEDTGTWDCMSDGVAKPLGGWEEKTLDTGVFIAKSGIYWPLGGGNEKTSKARGISRTVLGGYTCPEHRHRVSKKPGACDVAGCGQERRRQSSLVEEHFAARGWREPYVIKGCVRFVGAKQGAWKSGEAYVRSDAYGCWVPHPIEVSFKPTPKRARVLADGQHLQPWARMPGRSAPYDREERGAEAELMREMEEILSEQPENEHVFVE